MLRDFVLALATHGHIPQNIDFQSLHVLFIMCFSVHLELSRSQKSLFTEWLITMSTVWRAPVASY
jgi:hypothetical protein